MHRASRASRKLLPVSKRFATLATALQSASFLAQAKHLLLAGPLRKLIFAGRSGGPCTVMLASLGWTTQDI